MRRAALRFSQFFCRSKRSSFVHIGSLVNQSGFINRAIHETQQVSLYRLNIMS